MRKNEEKKGEEKEKEGSEKIEKGEAYYGFNMFEKSFAGC